MTAGTHKTENFPIPWVIMVRMSRKEAIFDGLFFPVEHEDKIEEEVSEATAMEIDDFRNECMKEKEDDLNSILLQNHKEVNKVCSQKKSPVCAFFLPFWKVIFDDGAIWYYCTLCHCFEQITLQESMNGVIKYSKKNTSSTWSHVLHRSEL